VSHAKKKAKHEQRDQRAAERVDPAKRAQRITERLRECSITLISELEKRVLKARESDAKAGKDTDFLDSALLQCKTTIQELIDRRPTE